MNGLSDVCDADVSVVCGADATADGSDVGSASYVDGEANVSVVSDANVDGCVDVTSVNGLSDVGGCDVSVVCGADATADGTDVGSVPYVDCGANVPVVPDTNVVICVDVSSVNGTSVVGDANVSVVCGAVATADGTEVGSVPYVEGEAKDSVVSVTNIVCCVDVTSATVSSDVDDADVSVVRGGDATADGTDVGTVSSVDGEANVSVVSDTNVVGCVDDTSVNGLSDVGEADVSIVRGADAAADGTDVGSVSYVDGEVNVSVVSNANVVCCVVVFSVNGSSDVS